MPSLEGLHHITAITADAPRNLDFYARLLDLRFVIHHVAWSAAGDGELERFRALAAEAGARPTPIIDRQYFHSIYFREPSGVLFELASRDIGFTVDEPLESPGEELKLPPRYEADRDELERRLTPLTNPRTGSAP